MVALAFGALGAAATGSTVGMPGLGFAIGSAVGQMLFREKPETTETTSDGPRLNDSRMLNSAVGAPIPKLWGRVRVSGNIIWSSPIQETRHVSVTETVSEVGKGGGGSSEAVVSRHTETSYTYSVDVGVALGEGPIKGIRKIWADGKLIYNIGGSASSATLAASAAVAGKIRVYPGDETHAASALHQSWKGTPHTPSYKGIVVVEFDNLQLGNYGNRIPNLEFEVVSTGTISYEGVEQATFNAFNYPDTDQGIDLILPHHKVLSDGSTHLWGFGTTKAQNAYDPATNPYGYGDSQYDRMVMHKITEYNGVITARQVQVMIIENDLFNQYGSILSIISKGLITTPQWTDDGTFIGGLKTSNGTTIKYVIWDNLRKEARELFLSHEAAQNEFIQIKMMCKWGQHIYVAYGASSPGWYLDYVNADGSTGRLLISGVEFTPQAGRSDVFGADSAGWFRAYDGATYVTIATYSHGSSSILAVYTTQIVNASGSKARGIWRTQEGFAFDYDGIFYEHNITDATTTTYTGDRATNGSATVSASSYGWTLLAGIQSNTSATTVLRELHSHVPRITSGDTVVLSDIVDDILTDAGYASADYDTSELIDTVYGYVRGFPMTARAAMEPLMSAYFFDGLEEDGQLVFRRRANLVSDRTIPSDELAAHLYGEDLPDELLIERLDAKELPKKVSISYWDYNRHMEVGYVYEARLRTESLHEISVELPLVLTPAGARSIAQTILYAAYAEAEQIKFTLATKHADLTPGDVVTVTPSEGKQRIVRIGRQTSTLKGPITIEGAPFDVGIYDPFSITIAVNETVSEDLGALSPPSQQELLDLPMLRDSDNQMGFYVAGTSTETNWPGMVLYKSSGTDGTYVSVGSVLNRATIGFTTEQLSAPPVDCWVWDRTNTLTVEIYSGGTLVSATEDEVLAGANALLVGQEIIQFVDATDNGDGTWTVSTLLRGRRGTDWASATHTPNGEKVVLLNTTTIYRVNDSLNDLNALIAYKAVTIGAFLDAAIPFTFTNTGAILKPFSPVRKGRLGWTKSGGDWTINWFRRSRFSAAALWTPMMGEETEDYEVDIVSSAGTVVRTLTTTATANGSVVTPGSQNAVYDAADASTDGVTTSSGHYAVVYQMSANVGRGFPSENISLDDPT